MTVPVHNPGENMQAGGIDRFSGFDLHTRRQTARNLSAFDSQVNGFHSFPGYYRSVF
jgi:hypothetical protein